MQDRQSLEAKRKHQYLSKKRELLKARIKRLHILEQGIESPFWKALKEELRVSTESSKRDQDEAQDPETMKDPTISAIKGASYGGRVRAYQGITLNVDKAGDKIQSMNLAIAEISRELKKDSTTRGKRR